MTQERTDGVYILKAERAYVAQTGHCKKTAQYYVGWSEDIQARFEEHRAGRGSRLCQVWIEAGIDFEIAAILPGCTRKHERLIKNSGHYARFLAKIAKPGVLFNLLLEWTC